MRLIAAVTENEKTKRLMIHSSKNGVFLFLFATEEDGACYADHLCETVEDAMESAKESFNVSKEDWSEIPDPLPNCQQDWIAPARVPGRESGKPEWGKLEALQNGQWVTVIG